MLTLFKKLSKNRLANLHLLAHQPYDKRHFSKNREEKSPHDDINSNYQNSHLFQNPQTVQASFLRARPDDIRGFENFKYIMPINVNQSDHENEKLASMLTLIECHFPRGGYILINDTIQRHIKRILDTESSEEAILSQCLEDGEKWERLYQPFCQKILTHPFEIIHWDHLLEQEKYIERLQLVKKTRLANAAYHESFERNIHEYMGYFFKNNPAISYEHTYNQALMYLEEESAAMSLWPELGIDIEIYPIARDHVMNATNEILIKEIYARPIHHAEICFDTATHTNDTSADANTVETLPTP